MELPKGNLTQKLSRLNELATAFRLGIEHCSSSNMVVTMLDFPNGSCGDASLLLAQYLRDNNAGEFLYVLGERGVGEHWTSHAWLEQDEIIVDITADQFDGFTIPVFVSINSPFHDTFEKDRKQTSDFRDYDEHTLQILGSTYFAILSCIQKLRVEGADEVN